MLKKLRLCRFIQKYSSDNRKTAEMTRYKAPKELNSIAEFTSKELPLEKIDGVFLDTIKPASVEQGWGDLQINQSITEKPLRIGNKNFVRGLGTHANSTIIYKLKDNFSKFETYYGIDRNGGPASSVYFEIYGDGVKLWRSSVMDVTSEAKHIEVCVEGVQELKLVVTDANDGIISDHANWSEPKLIF